MLKFTYKLKLTERVTAKCSRHPRYNPEKEGKGGIKGGCSGCYDLYALFQSREALAAAAKEFTGRAAPWTRIAPARVSKPNAVTSQEPQP